MLSHAVEIWKDLIETEELILASYFEMLDKFIGPEYFLLNMMNLNFLRKKIFP